MQQLHASAGDGRYAISIDGFATGGNGLILFMYGGDRIHNGGSVVAVPRLKSNAAHAEDRTADVWVSGVPGHKDTEVGIPIAKHMAVALNESVSLTIGIHVEHATRAEIDLLVANCHAAATAFIQSYTAASPRP